MLLASSNLSSIPSVAHGFFTRNGGVSSGIYASLNCGWGTSDDPANVAENRRRVVARLGAAVDSLLGLNQIHSAEVITVTQPWSRNAQPKVDAMVTNQAGIALGVLTADCTPVLFADRKNPVIGAAHAGWKGAFSGIVEQTLKAMLELGATQESIVCAIGPAIAQASYEVGGEFREIFLRKSEDNSQYFIPSLKAGYFLFDLRGFIYRILFHSGIQDINMLENDTYIEENTFFSYRRATHRREADYGRQISAIMIRE